ncbi:PIN domain nuclease [Nocardia sp. NPDC058497]|uniref:PIN domain nuclease n=1 Tax=Nocardia sp. NPDC058497 TaxID=3346529 RepID=UPI00364CB502
MAAPVYLADTSVFVLRSRHEVVRKRFNDLLLGGRLAACQMIALEYLDNAPESSGYDTLWRALHSMRWIDVTTESMNRAMDVHRQLAERGHHRNFKLPDLIIAATAELGGATVLHYDTDFDRIAEITGQPTEWVTERGSL